jgi:hypothetical protein
MVLTDAQRAKAYRDRKRVRHIAESEFGGSEHLTVKKFLEVVNFDHSEFWERLEELDSEETEYFTEKSNEVWQEAFDEAIEEDEDYDPDEDEDAEFRDAANDALREWQEVNYDPATCLEYALSDLIDAYREAHNILRTEQRRA